MRLISFLLISVLTVAISCSPAPVQLKASRELTSREIAGIDMEEGGAIGDIEKREFAGIEVEKGGKIGDIE